MRGLAPELFVRTEGLFWYGADDYPGLAQLIKRKAAPEEVAATRAALDQALTDAEAAVGSGPGSTVSVITIVSLVAIGVVLLILNWFFHKVCWSDHLAELHGKKRTILRGAGLSVAAAQIIGLAMLGFSSVYREGFETVLFLQAIVLEAGVGSVVEGVLLASPASPRSAC